MCGEALGPETAALLADADVKVTMVRKDGRFYFSGPHGEVLHVCSRPYTTRRVPAEPVEAREPGNPPPPLTVGDEGADVRLGRS
jgi:hypothetical protein